MLSIAASEKIILNVNFKRSPEEFLRKIVLGEDLQPLAVLAVVSFAWEFVRVSAMVKCIYIRRS